MTSWVRHRSPRKGEHEGVTHTICIIKLAQGSENLGSDLRTNSQAQCLWAGTLTSSPPRRVPAPVPSSNATMNKHDSTCEKHLELQRSPQKCKGLFMTVIIIMGCGGQGPGLSTGRRVLVSRIKGRWVWKGSEAIRKMKNRRLSQ